VDRLEAPQAPATPLSCSSGLAPQPTRPPASPKVTMTRHPLLWCGMNSTLFGKHLLDQCAELHGTSSRALNMCESTYVNLTGYGGPTRSASFRTEVKEAVTCFVMSLSRCPLHGFSSPAAGDVYAVSAVAQKHPSASEYSPTSPCRRQPARPLERRRPGK
jgi:hypothetical protein